MRCRKPWCTQSGPGGEGRIHKDTPITHLQQGERGGRLNRPGAAGSKCHRWQSIRSRGVVICQCGGLGLAVCCRRLPLWSRTPARRPVLSLFWIGCMLPEAPPTESDVGSQTSFLSFWTGCGEVEQRFHQSVLGPGPVDSPPQRQNKLAKRAGACSSNGERDSDPASPMTYATGNQPRP